MNIGQAAKLSGLTSKNIRYYESIGLVPEASRTDSGYRQYTSTDIQALRFIKRCRDLGFSINRIKTLLDLLAGRIQRSADLRKMVRENVAEIDQDIQKIQLLRDHLQQLADKRKSSQRPECLTVGDFIIERHR